MGGRDGKSGGREGEGRVSALQILLSLSREEGNSHGQPGLRPCLSPLPRYDLSEMATLGITQDMGTAFEGRT